MKKRILSIILAIAMLFTLCVPTAFAADVKMANYSTTAGVCMLSWSDAEAMEYSVTVYNASTGAVAWSGTTSYNYLYARMIGLVSGTTYYYTVTASGSTTPAQSAEFTYDSSLETVEVIVAGATYDYYNDKLTWTSSGTIAQFKVEVYSADSNSLIRTLYTTNNYISGDEAFQDTGSYYYKVRIVDANGNNVGDTNYWYYCPSDSTYSFSATVKVTFDANGGYFNGDESQTTVTLKVDRNTCLLSEFPTDWFLYGKVLNGFYTSASGGYQIYEDYEFYEDTLLYVHYDDCDHTTSTTSATCEEDAICSVCGMTLSAKGHNYVDGVCTVCGESEASEDEGSDSVTVSDSENSEILSQVIDTNSVESATISIDTTGSAAAGSTGTLTLSSVTSTVSSLTFDGSTTGSSITLSPTTSANITTGETLTGKETTTSGNETNLSGTVLFYGDLSYSSLNVSGATITMNLAVTGTVDPDSVVLLHNGTSGWEKLSSTATLSNGTLTITGTLTGLSPVMVLTVEADEPTVDYGTVWVGNIELSDGEYTTDGSTKTSGTPSGSGYAYYSEGTLYLNSFTCEVKHAYTTYKYVGGIQTSSATSLTIDVTGTNTFSNNWYGIYTEDCDVTITGSGTLTIADDDVVGKAIYLFYGDLTIAGGVTVILYGSEGSIEIGGAGLTVDNATLNAYAYIVVNNDIVITNGSIVTSTISNYQGLQGANVTVSKNSTVTITGTGKAYHGIWACGDDNDIGILTVSDSIVTVDITGTHVYAGIGAWSDTVITNSTINVSVTNTDADDMYYFYAVGSDIGDVTISKSTVNATIATTVADCYYSAAIYSYGGEIAVTASDITADGGILTYDDYEETYGTITLTPGTGKTLEVMLGKGATPISYSEATSITGSAWVTYTYISIIQADAGGTSHTHSYTSEVTAATCTTDGEITYTCAECGDSYTETIPATGHNYDSGVETRAATCAEDGEITYTCSVCGDSYTETILATGEHDYVEDTVIDATCTENMKIGTFCSLCGAEDPNNPAEEIANTALGHDWDGTYHDATCTEDSYILYTCTACGETYTEAGYEPATGHDYEAVVTQPTCTEGGYTTYTCSTCGDSYTADETEALGHNVESDCIYFDWDYGDVTVTVLCSNRCGTVLYSGDADEVKSEYTDPTCTTNGFTTYTATYYNDISDQTYYNTFVITNAGSATGHIWDEGSVTLEATCETPGSITYNCTVCGADYAEEIPATGHSYEAVVTAPTCTEGGYTTYTCSVCRDSYTADETEATGHSYTESYLWDDDFTSCTITLICDNCSSVVQYVSATDDEVTITEVDGLFTVTLIHDGVTYSTSVQTYTVTWVDGDGNEIQVDSRLLEGATVSYTGSTPTKASDNTYSYTFSGWDKTIEAVSGNTTYTATFTASAHDYVANFDWADNLKSASVTLTCSDCGHTVEIDSSEVTIKSTNNLGVVTRVATVEYNGVTYTDSVTTGTSLLVISADYTAVNLAIARANGLDASNYSNFDTVTAAINSVQWGLNVLNQATVTAYAEAITTAIDNLEAIETVLVEETVEIDEPIEGTDTDTETDDVDVGDNTETEPETNPTTGLTLALLPMAVAIVGAVANKRR